jgi:hypothetical protein
VYACVRATACRVHTCRKLSYCYTRHVPVWTFWDKQDVFNLNSDKYEQYRSRLYKRKSNLHTTAHSVIRCLIICRVLHIVRRQSFTVRYARHCQVMYHLITHFSTNKMHTLYYTVQLLSIIKLIQHITRLKPTYALYFHTQSQLSLHMISASRSHHQGVPSLHVLHIH